MTQEEERMLTPKLRFPEFRNEPRWKVRRLGDLLVSITNGLSLPQTVGNDGIMVTRIETIADQTIDLTKVGRVITCQDISVYKLNPGDILFSNINSVAHIGKTAFVDKDYSLYHGMNLLRLDVDRSSNVPEFVFLLLNTESVRSSIRARANKAVNQASINQTELARTVVAIPEKPEQQKVAECLSTLDELIEAESRKLDALKDHKKGLMQQLFPREGETRPRLRFPEFQNAPDWEEKSIGDVGEVVTGSTPSTAKREYYGGDIPFVSPADISELRFVETTKTTLTELGFAQTRPIRAGSTVFVCIGSIGKVAQIRRDSATNQQINSVIPNSDHDDAFVYYALVQNADRVTKLAGVQTVPIVNKSQFSSVPLMVPRPDEQRRIAACLSSLDDLIAAQSEKLKALRTHKRGLMQQLFPSPDAIDP